MIDYLEALLEEEAEENGEELTPGRKVIVRTASQSSPLLQENEGEDRGGDEPSALEESAERGKTLWPASAALASQAAWAEGEASLRQEPGEPEREAGMTDLLPERLTWERRAAEAALLSSAGRRETEGAALYEALRRAARTARAGRQGPGTVALTLPDRAASAPGLTLTDIDRAVQRDARRFDGGYTLY